MACCVKTAINVSEVRFVTDPAAQTPAAIEVFVGHRHPWGQMTPYSGASQAMSMATNALLVWWTIKYDGPTRAS